MEHDGKRHSAPSVDRHNWLCDRFVNSMGLKAMLAA